MGGVDEALEVVGGAEARRGGVETADVVAERSVVGMFLDGHYLYGVVAVFCDAGQDFLAELVVCADALPLLGHAYMALVDEQGLGVGGEFLHLELIGMLRVIDLGGEYLGVGILHHPRGVCGDALPLSSVPGDEHLEEVAVAEGVGGEVHLPVAVPYGGESVFILGLPVGECADEPYAGGVGGIFTECPPVAGLVEPEIIVCVCKSVE